jgi:hypothetical protein
MLSLSIPLQKYSRPFSPSSVYPAANETAPPPSRGFCEIDGTIECFRIIPWPVACSLRLR